MNFDVKVNSQKIRKSRKRYKVAKLILLVLFILLALSYLVFAFIYNGYNFTITLDKNLYYENNVIIYDDKDYKVYRQEIKIPSLEYFDNINEKWIPKDVNKYDGSHNGKNYLAYSFYIENMGEDIIDYWSEIVIDDIIKNVDEAIRFKVYFDDEITTYAKVNSTTKKAEKNTEPFYDEETIMLQHVEEFKPNEIHKYTIVMWLEGKDPDCTDNLIGGELRAHMTFNSEYIDGGKNHGK